MLAFLESLEFLEILRLLKFENFITMVRRNLGSATPPSVMALFFSLVLGSPFNAMHYVASYTSKRCIELGIRYYLFCLPPHNPHGQCNIFHTALHCFSLEGIPLPRLHFATSSSTSPPHRGNPHCEGASHTHNAV